MATKTEEILATVLAITIIVAAAVVLHTLYTIHNVGRINAIGIGVYSDSTCTQSLTSINWGTRNPGEVAGVSAYVKNIQTVNLTMTLSTSNWNPSIASQYLALSWNYSGQVLTPNQVLHMQFQLSIASNVQGIASYSFDININATQHA
jgi:hypothetical protein